MCKKQKLYPSDYKRPSDIFVVVMILGNFVVVRDLHFWGSSFSGSTQAFDGERIVEKKVSVEGSLTRWRRNWFGGSAKTGQGRNHARWGHGNPDVLRRAWNQLLCKVLNDDALGFILITGRDNLKDVQLELSLLIFPDGSLTNLNDLITRKLKLRNGHRIACH